MPGAPSFSAQHGFSARFEWGEPGMRALAPHVATIIIVDVLSFSTSVEIATSRGACVLPVPWKDERAGALAKQHQAVLAGSGDAPWSLRPSSLVAIPAGTRLVLPSPNGAMLTSIASKTGATVIVGSLRNAGAIGARCRMSASDVAVIAAGERWNITDGPLRPSVEDQIGAGAILSAIGGNPSPEAIGAIGAFEAARHNLLDMLWETASGRELVERGYPGDVALAAELDAAASIPVVQKDGFIADGR